MRSLKALGVYDVREVLEGLRRTNYGIESSPEVTGADLNSGSGLDYHSTTYHLRQNMGRRFDC